MNDNNDVNDNNEMMVDIDYYIIITIQYIFIIESKLKKIRRHYNKNNDYINILSTTS